MSEEELKELEDELAAARAEVERLQTTAADREARAAHLEAQLAGLRGARGRAQGRARGRAPEVPAELVEGATVEEIDASVQRARETVAKVRGHIETQAQVGRVPVGS